jgi:hypothetical protein
MRAILFDPNEKDTTVVNVADWDEIKALIGCDIMSPLTVSEGTINGVDLTVSLFYDDDGFAKADNGMMHLVDLATPMSGKCVLAGYTVDEEGDMTVLDFNLPLPMAKLMVKYIDLTPKDFTVKTTLADDPDGFVIRQELKLKGDRSNEH